MRLFSRTRFCLVLASAALLLGVVHDTAYAFPKSALVVAGWSVSDIVIMAMSALLGVLGGLWVFLRTRPKKPRVR